MGLKVKKPGSKWKSNLWISTYEGFHKQQFRGGNVSGWFVKRHRKWMLFSLFLSVLCECRDTPLASLSPVTPLGSEVGPTIIDKVHCNVPLKLKSLPPPATLWLLHSARAESQAAGVGFPPRCQTTIHLHFVHNPYFSCMNGAPAVALTLTCG